MPTKIGWLDNGSYSDVIAAEDVQTVAGKVEDALASNLRFVLVTDTSTNKKVSVTAENVKTMDEV